MCVVYKAVSFPGCYSSRLKCNFTNSKRCITFSLFNRVYAMNATIGWETSTASAVNNFVCIKVSGNKLSGQMFTAHAICDF